VLDYAVKSIYDKAEEKLMGVIEDINLVEECARINTVDLLKHCESIEKDFSALSNEYERNSHLCGSDASQKSEHFFSPTAKLLVADFANRLESYLSVFNGLLALVQKQKRIITKKATELIDFFGEDHSSCNSVKIFSVLHEFRRALAFSKESVEWKLQRAAANEATSDSQKISYNV
jgi:hypothetical protein